MTHTEAERQHDRLLAVVALTKLPNHPSIGRHYTWAGKGDPEIIKRDLGTAYVQHVRQTFGADVSCIISLRRSARLMLVKRA